MAPFCVILYNSEGNTESISPCQELINNLAKTPNIDQKGKLLTDYWRSNRRKNVPSLKIIINEILKEAIAKESIDTLGHCYFVLGWIEHDYNYFDNSLEFFTKSQTNFHIVNNQEGLALALNGAGVTFWFKGNYEMAFKRLLDANEIAQELNNKDLLSVITANIGSLFLNVKLYEEAVKYFEISLATKDTLNINRAIQESNLGSTYTFLKKFELAEKHIGNALKFCDSEDHAYFKTFFLLSMGSLKKAAGKIKEARSLFGQTNKLASKFNVPRQKASALLELVLLDENSNNPKRNLIILQECLKIFQEQNSKAHEAQTLLALSKTYQALNDFKKAYEASEKTIELETQIFNDEMINIVGLVKVQQERKENKIYKNLYNEINIISRIGQTITSNFNIKEIGEIIYKDLSKLLKYDLFSPLMDLEKNCVDDKI